MRMIRRGVATMVMAFGCCYGAGADGPPSDVGNFYPFLDAHARQSTFSLAFDYAYRGDVEQWKAQGRAQMLELLAYHPPKTSPEPEVLETVKRDGFTRYTIRYFVAPDRKTEAFLLVPDNLKGKAPAIMALHDHSGYYYSGKEKMSEIENPPASLKALVDSTYEGRYLGDELARRGYVVFAPDALYFGSQRLDPAQLPPNYTAELKDLPLGSDEYIRAFNTISSRHESLVAKTMFTSGATWPGIMAHNDRVSLNYLLSRPEVDADRIGCVGLSLGGYRSAHLFGLDARIKVGVIAGWMTTFESLMFDHLHSHTWMIYVPRQHQYLDLPDVVTLNAPRPVMVINCSKDSLFPMEGMKAAEAKIAHVYSELKVSENFKCNYYDVPHSLKIQAQDDAIAWLDAALRN